MSDELGFNKIAGAILATALAFIGIKELAHAAYHPHMPDVPAYGAETLAAAQAAAAKGAVKEAPLPFPQPSYIAAMNADAGAKVFAKCKSCHTVNEGGANLTGPNLYGILNNKIGASSGFGYSAAFKAADLNWGYEELDAYLTKPKAYIKGTAMSFVGLKKEDQRAAVIAYLRSNGDEGVALPVAATVEASAASDAMTAETDSMTEKAMDAVEGKAEDMKTDDHSGGH